MFPKKESGRDGGDRAAPKDYESAFDGIAYRTASLIARAAIWELLPVELAERLTRLTEARHE
jgi:hypothetical protein